MNVPLTVVFYVTKETSQEITSALLDNPHFTAASHSDAIDDRNTAQEKVAKLEKEIDSLSRQLAAERLRADNGWARYENANMEQKLAREELAKLNADMSEKPDYVEIASACGYTVEFLPNGKAYYVAPTMLPSRWFSTRAEAFKAACEDNGLLGEK